GPEAFVSVVGLSSTQFFYAYQGDTAGNVAQGKANVGRISETTNLAKVITVTPGGNSDNQGIIQIANPSTTVTGTTATDMNLAGLYVNTVDTDTISLLVRNSTTGAIDMADVGTANAQADPGVLTIEAESTGSDTDYNLITAYNSLTRSDASSVFRVNGGGGVFGEGAFSATGADYAEYFATDDLSIEAGDLVSIATPSAQIASSSATLDNSTIEKPAQSYDQKLLGIVSTKPGFVGNSGGGEYEDSPSYRAVTLAGRVPTKVSTENGPIFAGDYLTSSSVPGVAMRATEAGEVVGKALEDYSTEGVGKIVVFVSVSWADADNALASQVTLHSGQIETLSAYVDRAAQFTSFSDSGNMGIGIASPSFRFSVVDSTSGSGDGVAAITNNDATDSFDNIALRLNTGAASTTTNARFVTFYAGVTSGDTGGVAVGHINLNNDAVNYATSGADYAEEMQVTEDVEFGDIIGAGLSGQGKAAAGQQLVGVVSDSAGFTGNFKQEKPEDVKFAVVGLLGQIRTKVSIENGPITRGDPITTSSVPGVGMKATGSGSVVGAALESYDGTEGDGKILVFVNPHWMGNDLSVSQEGGQLVNLDPEELRAGLASLGLVVNSNGVLEVDTVKVRKVATSFIELTDQQTGVLYCTWIQNGEWVKVQGECDTISFGNESAPPAEEPPAEQPPAEEPPPVEEPPAEQPPVEEPPAEQPPAEEPSPVEEPPAEQPPAEEPPAEEPPAEEPPPVEEPPADQPPAEEQPPESPPPDVPPVE
ncbi:MAG: hypothetical protein Q7S63_02665, partial [bacterium]|nr:hypothetical protein [bacterium]